MKRYTDQHEYIVIDGTTGTVGITDFAQQQLGDIVHVELPENGKELQRGAEAAVVESVKAAGEVYAPVSGKVMEVNDALTDKPELVNEDPEGAAWLFKIEVADKSELEGLMDAAAYQAFVEGLS